MPKTKARQGSVSKRVDDGSRDRDKRGWKGDKRKLEKGILKAAKSHNDQQTDSNSIDDSPMGSSPNQLTDMISMRMESTKVAKRLEGNYGYDPHPEKTFKALEDIELLSTSRSVRMSSYHATRLSQQLLESTARLRKARDAIARRANEKETELADIRAQISVVERDAQNNFMGAPGEHLLNKRIQKQKKRVDSVEQKLEWEEFQTRKLERMKWHLKKAIMGLLRSEKTLEREILTVSQSDGHARRKRLELYQSLAREKRALDKITDKVERIRLVQQAKLQEVGDCANEQKTKFQMEIKKREKRKRRVTAQIEEANKKTLSRIGAQTFKINAKKTAIDVQLAPLEDVFYKIRIRTGLSDLTTDQIVELFHSQENSEISLRKGVTDSMDEIDRLRDKIQMHEETLGRMENAEKDTSQQKSFYHELDIVEKRSAHASAVADRRRTAARKANLNVTCLENFIKRIARELHLLNLDEYNKKDLPLNMRNIDSYLREKKYGMAMSELDRVVKILKREVSTPTAGTTSMETPNDHVGATQKRVKRGVLSPEDDFENSRSSPTSISLMIPRTSTGNIRVATCRATESNGYDSDAADVADANNRGSVAAWQTPRDGISLRGGNGLPPSGRHAPSTASSSTSRQGGKNQATDIFGVITPIIQPIDTVGEEDISCMNQREQIKQVTSMVLHRARKLTSKGVTDVGVLMPRSPKRRSLVVNDEDESLFSNLLSKSFDTVDKPQKVSDFHHKSGLLRNACY